MNEKEDKKNSSWISLKIFGGEKDSKRETPLSEPGFSSGGNEEKKGRSILAESTGLLKTWGSKLKSKVTGTGETLKSVYEGNYTYFIISLLVGIGLIVLSTLFIPFIVLSPYKFTLLFTLGSMCIIASFAFIKHPYEYAKSLFASDKLPFSLSYLISLLFSIYFSLINKSYIGVIIATLVQVFNFILPFFRGILGFCFIVVCLHFLSWWKIWYFAVFFLSF
jgi:hypothetical protein